MTKPQARLLVAGLALATLANATIVCTPMFWAAGVPPIGNAAAAILTAGLGYWLVRYRWPK